MPYSRYPLAWRCKRIQGLNEVLNTTIPLASINDWIENMGPWAVEQRQARIADAQFTQVSVLAAFGFSKGTLAHILWILNGRVSQSWDSAKMKSMTNQKLKRIRNMNNTEDCKVESDRIRRKIRSFLNENINGQKMALWDMTTEQAKQLTANFVKRLHSFPPGPMKNYQSPCLVLSWSYNTGMTYQTEIYNICIWLELL